MGILDGEVVGVLEGEIEELLLCKVKIPFIHYTSEIAVDCVAQYEIILMITIII